MDQYYPTNGSSTLSYKWINITLPTDLHLHQHHPTEGSLLSLSYQWIINIILPMDLLHHYPIERVSATSYQWINFTLPMDYRHPINETSLSYQWRINIIILSMEHHHPPIDEAISSYRYHHPINEESLFYQWSINIIILSMKHHHHPIMYEHYPTMDWHHPTNGLSSSYP
ncbi:hypothetical protein KY284_029947 [Solanum tuberosum]|nr:hypothetical protein KY284_029947 [Solanum tuberosum]